MLLETFTVIFTDYNGERTPIDFLWADSIISAIPKWRRCYDVRGITVMDNSTGELMYSYDDKEYISEDWKDLVHPEY